MLAQYRLARMRSSPLVRSHFSQARNGRLSVATFLKFAVARASGDFWEGSRGGLRLGRAVCCGAASVSVKGVAQGPWG